MKHCCHFPESQHILEVLQLWVKFCQRTEQCPDTLAPSPWDAEVHTVVSFRENLHSNTVTLFQALMVCYLLSQLFRRFPLQPFLAKKLLHRGTWQRLGSTITPRLLSGLRHLRDFLVANKSGILIFPQGCNFKISLLSFISDIKYKANNILTEIWVLWMFYWSGENLFFLTEVPAESWLLAHCQLLSLEKNSN